MKYRSDPIQISAVLSLTFVIVTGCATSQETGSQFQITPNRQAALDSISPVSLRKHLEYIASDELGGRDTPSPGLDLAADYIAKQFRVAGLEPVGDDGYFQTARWRTRRPNEDSFALSVSTSHGDITLSLDQISTTPGSAIDLVDVGLIKIDFDESELPGKDVIAGKVVLTEIPDFRRVDRVQRRELFSAQRRFMTRMAELEVVAVLSVDRHSPRGSGFGRPPLIDPENVRPSRRGPQSNVPRITIHHEELVALFDEAGEVALDATITLRIGAPEEKPVALRNVIGLLRGSDPKLRDTYVLVTAHYDHIGTRAGMPEGEDNIFNGANDDGSGTVSVIELAGALAKLKPRPRRSILFMCVFGEERGLLGSRYYGRNPIFPIEATVADINLEQIGRTDSTEGPQVLNASMTGFDFSEVGEIFARAGQLTGIEVYKHETNSDSYFGRSDNQALADQGVPAHTICVAFNYEDYHGAGDHADKIDYENMAAVNRMIATGILMIADNDHEPRWYEWNPKASRYLRAWRERREVEGK